MKHFPRFICCAAFAILVLTVSTSFFLLKEAALAQGRFTKASLLTNWGKLGHEHLSLKAPSRGMQSRYETPEVWRADNLFDTMGVTSQPQPQPPRPKQRPASSYESMSKYLQQTLVSDYPIRGIDDIFVIIKTGGGTMWQRLPVHFFTTMTRIENFALYSDSAGSIGGYEVIDILKDLPEDVLAHEQLQSYRLMRKVHDEGYRWDHSEINFGEREDGWDNDKFKNLPALIDAYRRSPDSKWFVMIDDDTYIMWETLAEYLSSLDHTEPLLLGYREPAGVFKHHGDVMRSFAHGGSGIVISKGAADLAVGDKATEDPNHLLAHWSHTTLNYCCGDFMLAWILFVKANVTLDSDKHPERSHYRFQGERIAQTRVGTGIWCDPLVSFHHLTSHEIEVLWEYERLSPRGRQILHCDFYRDFILPYVVDEREDWYLDSIRGRHLRKDTNLTVLNVDGEEIFPHLSKDHCIQACEAQHDCLTWSFWQGTCCLLDGAVHGVKADQNYKMYEKVFGSAPKVYTGWMVDRIRRIRSQMLCDPLGYDEKTGEYNDTPETSEGWAIRARKRDIAERAVPGL